jgi:hypothetical protein
VSAGALSVERYCAAAIVEGWPMAEEKCNNDELSDKVMEE